ncbi:MAG TPA: hypothetical protein VMG37_01525 [Solirubrobacteraceae bacterium]|nr:hypothetical protein [Solirubrobacteraceae bacterium]
MTTTAHNPSRLAEGAGTFADRPAGDPAYQAYWLLRVGFTVAPIAFGVDKFANVLVNCHYDIALRDFGLMLGALTLARLASRYDPPGLTNVSL